MVRVYLSGHLDGDWQDDVKKRVIEATFFDPRTIDSDDPEIYTFDELDEIYKADLIFAYLSKDNPSGIGLALEVGYGRSENCYIILVNEKKSKKWDIVEACADQVFDNLDDGIDYLQRFIMLEQS